MDVSQRKKAELSNRAGNCCGAFISLFANHMQLVLSSFVSMETECCRGKSGLVNCVNFGLAVMNQADRKCLQ